MANTSRFPTNPNPTPKSPEGTTGNLGHAASELRDKAHEAASNLGQKAQDVGSQLRDKAQDVGSQLRDKAQHAASTAGHKTEDALSNVGDTMSSLAGTIRERAPREGVLGSAAGAVASRLETGGHYLQQHGLNDMTDDLSSLIRQNPLPSLLVGFGVGVMLGMALRR